LQETREKEGEREGGTWVSSEEGGDRRSVAGGRNDAVCEQESRRRRHLSSQVAVETARPLKRGELK